MKYHLYYDKECETCKEFIRIFNEYNIEVILKDIEEKVGWQPGAYRWEQIDLTEEFGHPSSFIPMVLMVDGEIKKLLVGGTTKQENENLNKNINIFTSHDDGIQKLIKIVEHEKVN